MKRALFLPFMQLPTGHHHVADALMEEIETCRSDVWCDKVDILSYSYGLFEKVISSAYLNWIKYFPNSYDWLYKFAAYDKEPRHNRSYVYEAMFMYFFKRLLDQQNAHTLFCTHALPSNMASVLKRKHALSSVTVNVYTDYFINHLWGIEGIDYHLAPTVHVKEFLISKGVKPEAVYVTGVPVAGSFQKEARAADRRGLVRILVTGGSLGAGALRNIASELKSDKVHYYILCGKNNDLYEKLLQAANKSITPVPYIANKADMDRLYNTVDAVITKPGGVTISECLVKRKPLFLYDPLPGQERINAGEMARMGTAVVLDKDRYLEEQVLQFFTDKQRRKTYEDSVDAYHRQLDKRPLSELLGGLIEND
ncbi:UDP-N-acetylglucosamine:LPS N-acetylglucosamine transferase [Lentibacillus persicus]|uniref:UDP-N-acetylglucosamine:LPS N-acetylglucosamine transferase n=1 Tax=Lentibacillus persicus TaxID=640948 RepID=A0A1I1WMP3_9BACI|nr:glycosyltransferase [Lentibacillus persicus]SFD96494.1 UDP-N-acetylglucosamine:LPS N-acetylglucosamine transferase [Lentibacillus persicus]